MPEDEKNTDYWLKRRKNNEAARRSREKRKMNDVLLERRVMVLTEENKQLKAQLLAIKMKYGELGDLCSPLTSSVSLGNDFFDSNKFDADSSDSPTDMQSLMSHSQDPSSNSKLFTSKVFTNASGDTSATVHVNRLPGNSQIPSNKFLFSDIASMAENSMTRSSLDISEAMKARSTILPNFEFSNELRIPNSIEKQPTRISEPTLTITDEKGPTRQISQDPRLSRLSSPTEEEAALLLAGKFNSDILRTLNINKQQVQLPNLNQLTKEALSKFNSTPYAASPATNGSNLSHLSLPIGMFFKSLRENAYSKVQNFGRKISDASEGESYTNGYDDKDMENYKGSPERGESDEDCPEKNTSDRRESSDTDGVPPKVPRVAETLTHSPEEISISTTPPHADENPKKSPVQLPHKLRLKKTGNFEKT